MACGMVFILSHEAQLVFFLYVDDSGQAGISRSRRDNGLYVLGGAIVHETRWKGIEADLTNIKKKFFPMMDPEEWELHAHDMWHNRGIFSDEKLGINYDQKQRIFSEVLEIARLSDATLIGVVIYKDNLKDRYAVPRPMAHAWTLLVDQFENFLKRHSPGTNAGMLCIDASDKGTECNISALISKLVKNGTPFQSVDHVVENPLFVKSHLRGMIQLSDMIAYVVHRHHKGNSQFKAWFEDLFPKTYRPSGGLGRCGIITFP